MLQTTAQKHLRAALVACKIPPDPRTGRAPTWYECTRHTGASHYVMADGSLEKLAAILGHSSVEVTKRYAHLKPELFPERDCGLLDVDLARRGADVVPLAKGAVGPRMGQNTGVESARAGGSAK